LKGVKRIRAFEVPGFRWNKTILKRILYKWCELESVGISLRSNGVFSDLPLCLRLKSLKTLVLEMECRGSD